MDAEDEYMSDTMSTASEELTTRKTDAQSRTNDQGDTVEESRTSMLAPKPSVKRAQRPPLEKQTVEKENLQPLFAQRRALASSLGQGELQLKEQWMSVTKSLIAIFMVEKAFFPEQRHHEFLGYTRQARYLAHRKSREKMVIVSQIGKGESLFYAAELSPLTDVRRCG